MCWKIFTKYLHLPWFVFRFREKALRLDRLCTELSERKEKNY